MKRALLVLVSLTALAMAQPGEPWKAPPEADHLKDPMATNAKAAAIGGKVFQSLCWTCHGMQGHGDGPNAAVLKVRPADLGSAVVQGQSNGALYWKITHGRGEMASYEQVLSREDRWALAHYIRTLARS
ncbi:MAG: cytochrome c [Flavobacteriales bacterium]|jgi:mono/diheme cytochrome c family protein|nr:cytochrome c [Flavobacteriales bacterium]